MAKSLPSQRFWDTIEILRITKGENITENDTELSIHCLQGMTHGELNISGKTTFPRGFSTFF